MAYIGGGSPVPVDDDLLLGCEGTLGSGASRSRSRVVGVRRDQRMGQARQAAASAIVAIGSRRRASAVAEGTSQGRDGYSQSMRRFEGVFFQRSRGQKTPPRTPPRPSVSPQLAKRMLRTPSRTPPRPTAAPPSVAPRLPKRSLRALPLSSPRPPEVDSSCNGDDDDSSASEESSVAVLSSVPAATVSSAATCSSAPAEAGNAPAEAGNTIDHNAPPSANLAMVLGLRF